MKTQPNNILARASLIDLHRAMKTARRLNNQVQAAVFRAEINRRLRAF